MRNGFQIRKGRAEDAERLAVLAVQVWLHTYAIHGITNEIARYVLSELTPEKFSATLHEADCHVFVAEHGENLVGFAVVRVDAPCPAKSDACVELQTLYVQEHYIGRGIGKALIQAAEVKASASESALWLTVNARNASAITFYAHQGYSRIGTAYFVLGEERHENHVLISHGMES
jgi:ribosomal protein S18 acetylase RimI-like enzyme